MQKQKNSGKQSVRRVRTPSRNLLGLDVLQQRRLNHLVESLQADRSYE
jgi:hypothetical protein